jgi:hypothetical protein
MESMKHGCVLSIVLAAFVAAAGAAFAQEPEATPPAAPETSSTTQTRPHLIELTRANWKPLRPSEKFELFWRDLVMWQTHLSLAADAALSLAIDDRSPYLGRGTDGYLRRYAIDLGDEAVFTFFQAYLFPTIFHEESRYIPLEQGSAATRALYAMTRVIVARTDSGDRTFRKSKILGTLAGVAVSSAYDYPPNRDSRLADTFSQTGISLGSDAAFNLIKEFWPDVARKIKMNVWIRNTVRTAIRDATRVR